MIFKVFLILRFIQAWQSQIANCVDALRFSELVAATKVKKQIGRFYFHDGIF